MAALCWTNAEEPGHHCSCAQTAPRFLRGMRHASQLLEGYLLQGIAPVALASKVLAGYKEAVHDAAVRGVRGGAVVGLGCVRLQALDRAQTWLFYCCCKARAGPQSKLCTAYDRL